MAILDNLGDTSFTTSQVFTLDPNYEHSFALNGAGTWQVWDGAEWKDYDESTGTSQAFRALPPPSGRVALSVTSGTVVAAFHRILPNGVTTKGR